MNNKKFNTSYIGRRDDILLLMPEKVSRVLDVGCSIGTLGRQIKEKNSAYVVGIEKDREMAKQAETILDKVIVGNIDEIKLSSVLEGESFDCVIFADILEHLKDPWKVVEEVSKFLTADGIVIASIPNIRHISTLCSLIKGYWPYRERGIHDRTHLRFFTFKNIKEMFSQAGLEIIKVKRNYRIVESRGHWFAKYLALPFIKDFLTFQYIVQAKKKV